MSDVVCVAADRKYRISSLVIERAAPDLSAEASMLFEIVGW